MSNSITEAARSIVASMKEQFSAPQTFVLVNAAEFAHLDLSAYGLFQTELQADGFRLVGDVEVLEISNSPTTLLARTFIRHMVSADGTTLATNYQTKPRIWRRIKLLARGLINLRLIDAPKLFLESMVTRHNTGFESELADGRHLATSNAQTAAPVSQPPTIDVRYFAHDTPPAQLLANHLARLKEHTAVDAPTPPLELRSMDDVISMQQRQHRQKVAHRAAIGWVTLDELRQLSNGQDTLANAVFAEIQKLVRDEQTAP